MRGSAHSDRPSIPGQPAPRASRTRTQPSRVVRHAPSPPRAQPTADVHTRRRPLPRAHSRACPPSRAAAGMCSRPRRRRACACALAPACLFSFPKFIIFVLTSGPVWYEALAQMASRRFPQGRVLAGNSRRAHSPGRPEGCDLPAWLGAGL